MKKCVCVSAAVWCFAVFSAAGTVVYVDAAATGGAAQDGESWDTAFTNLQDGVTAAVGGGTVFVARGTYQPINSEGKAVVIQSVSGPDATVIDGNNTSRCAMLTGANGNATMLRGFTLQNGNSSGNGGGAYYGTLVGCILKNNQADEYGGGSYGSNLESCLLTGNFAFNGGGAYNGILQNCTVYGNGVLGEGGGVYGRSLEESAETYNCIIWGNTNTAGKASNCGGAIYVYYGITTTPEAYAGGNSVEFDPHFVNAAAGDFRLQPYSIAIDRGDPSTLFPDAADLAGRPRVIGERMDVGAYEFASTGTTFYVSPSGSDLYSGSTWWTAKQTIQAAVDMAVDGDTIIVTNGIYAPFSVENKRLTIESVNGAADTIVDGDHKERCVRLGYYAEEMRYATLKGFTLRNGYGAEGGPGGVFFGNVYDCVITGNYGDYEGGGAYQSYLVRCVLSNNTVGAAGDYDNTHGGGAYECVLENCLVVGNTAQMAGGGVYGGTVINCTVVGNHSVWSGQGHGMYIGGGVASAHVENSIVMDNTPDNYATSAFNCTLDYTCTDPMPGETGNIAAAPLFVDAAGGDYRLQSGSPCINAGNPDFSGGGSDLAGQPRILGGRVDMGAYETGAGILYVAANGSDNRDGLTWATAKHTIQNAVDNAADGGRVIVGPGTHAPFDSSNKLVTIESADGAEATTIAGGNTQRCATLGGQNQTSTVLKGFTLSGGYAGNSQYGGGVRGGTLEDCRLTGNESTYAGGGAAYSVLNNCIIAGNRAVWGGGTSDSTLNNCLITNNTATSGGGGAHASAVNRSLVTANTAANGGGVHEGSTSYSIIRDNTAAGTGGGIYARGYGVTVTGCTVMGNTATAGGGGIAGTVVKMVNTIIWSNTAPTNANHSFSNTPAVSYSCTTPPIDGEGNISMDPLVDNHFRLVSHSPCRNTGNPADVSPDELDITGTPLLTDGRINMGALGHWQEAWTTNGVPTSWLADNDLLEENNYDIEQATLADTDGDGARNWMEYVMATDPQDEDDFLRMTIDVEDSENIRIGWEPDLTPGRYYILESVPTMTNTTWGAVAPESRFFRVQVIAPPPPN